MLRSMLLFRAILRLVITLEGMLRTVLPSRRYTDGLRRAAAIASISLWPIACVSLHLQQRAQVHIPPTLDTSCPKPSRAEPHRRRHCPFTV